ncbi:MAG TPA: hypothetical protein VHR38_02205 [Solirubrobacterales bacterium]|nr:hypothetical protein [Solirubrobacterales bacterium]
MRRPLSLLSTLTLLVALALPGAARADTTLGSTTQPAGSVPGSCEGAVIAQVADTAGTPYIVPSAGNLTAWQVDTTLATPGVAVTLVALRPTGGFGYTVVGADTHAVPSPVPSVASFTISAPIPVQSGDLLGTYNTGPSFACFFDGGATPIADALIALPSASTPTTGQSLSTDDYSGAGFTLNLAATLSTPATPKKKCKKPKKKRSAEAAKKKCKKKKKG